MPRRRSHPSFPLRIQRLEFGGVSIGEHEGRAVAVKGIAPGAVVEVEPTRKRRGMLHARILRRVEPPPGAVLPRCVAHGVCGGCMLQEMDLPDQRAVRASMALQALGPLEGVQVFPVRGDAAAYGYRNKVELTFGNRKYLTTEELRSGVPRAGRFLGFHPPGRFESVVDVRRCELVPEGLNAIVAAVREHLAGSALEPWDPKAHAGFWRHLLLRESVRGERLVGLYTMEPPDEAAAQEVRALGASLPGCRGVAWYTTGRVADAVVGEIREVLQGETFLDEVLGDLVFRLSPTAFFQSNTRGAEVLVATVREAAILPGTRPGRLLDLYCGTGALGLCLARHVGEVLGVESNAEAVRDAQANAERNGVANARFLVGTVEERVDALAEPADVVVVDPPRVGLHPRVTAWLAGHPARVLVYVACHAPSLRRDRALLEAGGWRLDAAWTVDLFPQTAHVEVVARFVRP